MLRRLDWSHLALLAFFAVVVGWYLFDTMQASRRIENLIFVVPLAGFALLLATIAAVRVVLDTHAPAPPVTEASAERETSVVAPLADTDEPDAIVVTSRAPLSGTTIALMFAFAVYVSAMDTIGFDIASVLFLGIALWIQGERRWLLLLAYTPLFALGAVWGFKKMLPYPMPTMLF
jgi:hypothetical protein